TEGLCRLASPWGGMEDDFQRASSMALQDPQGYATIRIPHPQGAVQAGRDQQRSIAFVASRGYVCMGAAGDKAHTNSNILMAVEYLEQSTRLNLTEHQTFVSTTRRDAFFVGTKRNPLYIVAMPLQKLQSFPCSYIPHPGRVIIGATGQKFS